MQTPTTSPTRRAIIGAIAMAAPATALAAIPAATATGISPALAEAIRRTREIAAAQNAFDPIEGAARARYEAGVAALPHFAASFPNQGGGMTNMTTDDERMVAMAKSLSRIVATDHLGNLRSFAQRIAYKQEDYLVAARHVAAGALWRERQIARLKRSSGLSAAIDESNRLSDEYAEVERAAIKTPVSTLADLRAKLAFMVEVFAFELDGTEAIIVADVDRIAAREA
jgi:hypothetical protein